VNTTAVVVKKVQTHIKRITSGMKVNARSREHHHTSNMSCGEAVVNTQTLKIINEK
jgi:hypothetical protein